MVFGFVKQRLNPWLHKAPSACVQRLLLAPDDGFGVGVHVEILSELSPRERVQLLNASDGGILEVVNVARSVFVQSSVGLTGTENDSVNLLWWRYRVAMLRIRNDPLKVRVPCEVFDGRAGKWMAEKRFGEEQDQCCGTKSAKCGKKRRANLTFPELPVHLPSKDVEKIGRCSHVGYLHVAVLVLAIELIRGWEDARIFVAKLQVALHSS